MHEKDSSPREREISCVILGASAEINDTMTIDADWERENDSTGFRDTFHESAV